MKRRRKEKETIKEYWKKRSEHTKKERNQRDWVVSFLYLCHLIKEQRKNCFVVSNIALFAGRVSNNVFFLNLRLINR